jgi:hypothetical protein
LPEQSLSGPSPTELRPNSTVSFETPSNLEGQVPVFIYPRNRVAQLYPWELSSLFVASYDSRGYGGDVLIHLQSGTTWTELKLKLIYDRQSVGQSVLVSDPHLEPMTRFLFSDNCRFLDVGRHLWQEDGSVVYLYNCFWALPCLGSKSHRTHDHMLLSHLRLPQLGGPGPCIYIPQEQAGLVIPLGTGFPFVTSYDSQSYDWGILTRLHMGLKQNVEVKVILRPTVSWPVHPGVRHPSGTCSQFLPFPP